ncbi:MAG: helix-turn-helix transcriptional regulator [Nitrospirota bacterium]
MAKSFNFETMLSILNRLDHGQKVTTEGLMEEFGKTRRSIERYFSMLRNAGFPIVYDRNGRFYKFDSGYHLGHAQFSAEESLVFGLAKSMLKQFGGKPGKVLESIAGKIAMRDTALPYSGPQYPDNSIRW